MFPGDRAKLTTCQAAFTNDGRLSSVTPSDVKICDVLALTSWPCTSGEYGNHTKGILGFILLRAQSTGRGTLNGPVLSSLKLPKSLILWRRHDQGDGHDWQDQGVSARRRRGDLDPMKPLGAVKSSSTLGVTGLIVDSFG